LLVVQTFLDVWGNVGQVAHSFYYSKSIYEYSILWENLLDWVYVCDDEFRSPLQDRLGVHFYVLGIIFTHKSFFFLGLLVLVQQLVGVHDVLVHHHLPVFLIQHLKYLLLAAVFRHRLLHLS